MRNGRENLQSALRALRENWLRSLLTMLGIIIGVGSVVLLIGIGQGVKEDISGQIDSLGPNTVVLLPGKIDPSGMPNMMSTLGISTLTEEDARRLARLPGVRLAVPIMFVYGTLQYRQQDFPAFIIAAPASIYELRRPPFAEGRCYRPEEENQFVCVLANGPKTAIFGDRPAVGQTLRVRGVAFRVLGALQASEEPSALNQFSLGTMTYLPMTAARRAFPGGQINRILLQTEMNQDPDRILATLRRKLLEWHQGHEDFTLLTQKQLLNTAFRLMNIVEALLVGISTISLVVAGIGIMNIMLVTVTERTREIGIRKTVGARRIDIFLQFLTEAVVLAFSGGAIGTLLALALCRAIARFSSLRPLVTPGAVLLAFGVCFAVGLLFGVAPALRAARMDPIEALRHE